MQNATSMSCHDDKLTLHGLAPTTLFFSDRPDRVTGHCSTPEFVTSWDQGEDSFASNPPNAALSIFHEDSVSDVVVELMNPKPHGTTLTCTVVILDGEMPAVGGPNSLFIDVIGRPLLPCPWPARTAATAGAIGAAMCRLAPAVEPPLRLTSNHSSLQEK